MSAEGLRHDELAGDDDSGADFWRRHLLAGLFLYGGATLLGAAYLLITPHGPHRLLEWSMVAVSVTSTSGVVALPRRAIIQSSRRLVFFVAWSAVSCAFGGVVAALDGGLDSPLALLLFLPVAFASLAYPASAVAGVGVLAAMSGSVAALVEGNTLAGSVVFVGVIAMLTVLAAIVARGRAEQQTARRALNHRLVELATRDGLTGCLNHRTFYERVSTELARSVRYAHSVSLLVIDIDDFKSINDANGHVVGDAVLHNIGLALAQAGRAIDPAGRIGGDEFAVLLVETKRSQAEEVAARIRQIIAHLDSPVPVSATIGLASRERVTPDLTPQQLVAAADAHLYELKIARRRG